MPNFAVENLKRDRLLDAWPVVRVCGPQTNPDWWLNDARQLIERGGGVLAARALDHIVHGIATYEPLDDKYRGRILAVQDLLSFELSHAAPVRRALCDALDDLSLALGCNGIAISTAGQKPIQNLS